MDALLVVVIVGMAAGYLLRTFYAKLKKGGERCSSCDSCAACCPVIRENRHYSARS
ncbi:MAG: FeoB-associated Cys-rich membrane protein [Deltaproteobacteria bacterium]|nr:FeoB-associated Cys-rich membrane protein [Deltaproteobacteria bacterium]